MSRVFASVSPFLAAALLVPAMAGDAMAQVRDPAYAAARSAGQVGEMPTGYLGIVGASTPDLKRIVDDINIKRKAVYAERAQAQHATVEEYAFTTGCKLVMQTQPGEKYQTPDGSWQVRGGAAPVRDSRCPA
ncbi:hypothetical protein FHW96_002756 [Novosphingobium sp. SG751A]|uniref:YdbL family protein n=1 Tax=Novosphingobium sp. SG751A TaxID=2587000 RepID=UPI001557B980|nr:YdbL family protein [Novosphingobium sp. SG751A]NOW46596.1 hypothetical protein [Novosphingobium sp. SG751A]